MEKNNKPLIFLFLKIIGVVGIVVGIAGAVISANGFGNFENNDFMIGGIMCCFGFFIGFAGLMTGFIPEISKLGAKTTKYIQEENKDTFTDIANSSADINSEAITKTAKAVKKGLKDTMFCKHCGMEIDADSKFCNKCGKEQ